MVHACPGFRDLGGPAPVGACDAPQRPVGVDQEDPVRPVDALLVGPGPAQVEAVEAHVQRLRVVQPPPLQVEAVQRAQGKE